MRKLPPKVIRNRLIPLGRNFLAINICGLIFAKGECGPRTLRHEAIHTAQMRELLYLPFYLWYLAEWMVRLLLTLSPMKAYYSISFEREAYANQDNADYLLRRPRFAFLRYLKHSAKGF